MQKAGPVQPLHPSVQSNQLDKPQIPQMQQPPTNNQIEQKNDIIDEPKPPNITNTNQPANADDNDSISVNSDDQIMNDIQNGTTPNGYSLDNKDIPPKPPEIVIHSTPTVTQTPTPSTDSTDTTKRAQDAIQKLINYDNMPKTVTDTINNIENTKTKTKPQ